VPAAGELAEDATTVRAAYRALEDGDEREIKRRLSADTFLEIGDGVLVAGRFLGDGEGDGVPFLHECSVREGRVSRIREYPA